MNKIQFEDGVEEGFGNCYDCIWHGQPGGCNVKRGSATCRLNYQLVSKEA